MFVLSCSQIRCLYTAYNISLVVVKPWEVTGSIQKGSTKCRTEYLGVVMSGNVNTN